MIPETVIQEVIERADSIFGDPAQTLRDGDYEKFLYRHFNSESGNAFIAFYTLRSFMPDAEYWRLLGSVWQDAETLYRNKAVWLELFKEKRAGRENVMTARERKKLESLPDTFTVYRGGFDIRGYSLSWTLDPKRAEFFYEYCDGPRRRMFATISTAKKKIWSAECRKKDVLAYFNGRKEREIVVDSRKLKNVQIVKHN